MKEAPVFNKEKGHVNEMQVDGDLYNKFRYNDIYTTNSGIKISVLLLKNIVKIMNPNPDEIERHAKDVQPEVLHIYIS
jgi:hypothetical protein